MNKINIALITGFLGSGKTSFLKNYAKKNKSRRIVYLVNEFSPTDIDSKFLSSEISDIISIPGGSIFCKCLVSEFIKHLREIPQKFHDIEGVIIEASGIANTNSISKMLLESRLDNIFNLTRILAIIFPDTFLKLLHTLPNIKTQIETADTVIINKIDISTPAKIAESEEKIITINPNCKIIKTLYANTNIELFEKRQKLFTNGEYSSCRDPNYTAFSTDYSFSKKELELITSKFKNSIYRIKGWINSTYLDYSGNFWNF
ncbi:MAG TPA: GTP-binding protein, partial [Victivallales bacterium]|nr:GTP-binding protein [Victivallales bacterium]